jgi:hypothetical protein
MQDETICKGRECQANDANGIAHSPECIFDTAKVQGWSNAPEAMAAAHAIKEKARNASHRQPIRK